MSIKKFTDIKRDKKIEVPQNIIQESIPDIQTSACSKLFSKLFESREMAQIYNLQINEDSGSTSQIALNEYHDSVLELIDQLIETWQGQYNIVEGYDIINTKNTESKDKIEYFKELAEFIKVERKCISEDDSHLQKKVDEIVTLVYKTLYKLRFNR
jgi:hypothetical protein